MRLRDLAICRNSGKLVDHGSALPANSFDGVKLVLEYWVRSGFSTALP